MDMTFIQRTGLLCRGMRGGEGMEGRVGMGETGHARQATGHCTTGRPGQARAEQGQIGRGTEG